MTANKAPAKKPVGNKAPAKAPSAAQVPKAEPIQVREQYPSFRRLRADEVEIKLLDGDATGAKVFFYAKTDAVVNILDETVGKTNWTASHYAVAGVVYCRVAVRDKICGEFVGKDNAGKASAFEPEKSAATDSFKRAAALWGIAGELANLPKIEIPFVCCDTATKGDKLFIRGAGYTLRELNYDDAGRIDNFIMDSRDGKEFRWQRQL